MHDKLLYIYEKMLLKADMCYKQLLWDSVFNPKST